MRTLTVSCLQLAAHDIEEAELALQEALAAIDAEARHAPDIMVLPECVYPAYYLAPWLDRPDLPSLLARALSLFQARAARWRTWLCVGLVEASEGSLYNSAYLIDREGEVRAKARKHLLWHFDHHWFESGVEFPVVEVDAPQGPPVRVGMMICADGRVPELCRALALQGAEVVLDVTNWVAYGRQWESLSNIQADHMISCRAQENQVYVVCANKVGMEKRSVLFCGRSQVAAPTGQLLAVASSHQPETLRCALSLELTPPPLRLHPVVDRRPQLYTPLVEDASPVDLTAGRHNALAVGLVQTRLDDAASLQRVADYVRLLEKQGAELVLLPEPYDHPWPSANALAVMGNALAGSQALVALVAEEAEGSARFKTLYLVNGEGIVDRYRKVHLENHERDTFSPGEEIRPWRVRGLTIGSMLGYEALLPEVARLHMVAGAELVLWPRAITEGDLLSVGITRAAENRLFVAMADNLWAGRGTSAVIDPGGQLQAPALRDEEQVCLALILPGLARHKLVVPGTDALTGRQPASYYHLLPARIRSME